MTVLDSFVTFARALPASRREEVEDLLAGLMDDFDDRYGLSAAETAELQRRAADPNPTYSDPKIIADIFGKPFRN